MDVRTLSTDLIRLDGDTQTRAEINEETVADYAEIWAANATSYPFDAPCVVMFDGSEYWMADGFHRAIAAARVDRDRIDCDVHNGTSSLTMRLIGKLPCRVRNWRMVACSRVGSQCLTLGVRRATSAIRSRCSTDCKSPESCHLKNRSPVWLINTTIDSTHRGWSSELRRRCMAARTFGLT